MWEHLIPALIDLIEGTLLLCSKVDSDLGLGDATYRILSCLITRHFLSRVYPIVVVLPNFPVNFVGNLFPVGVGYNPNSRDGRGGRAERRGGRSPRAGGAAGAGAGEGAGAGAGCRQVQVDGQLAETISELTQWSSRKTCVNLKHMQCCHKTFLKLGIEFFFSQCWFCGLFDVMGTKRGQKYALNKGNGDIRPKK